MCAPPGFRPRSLVSALRRVAFREDRQYAVVLPSSPFRNVSSLVPVVAPVGLLVAFLRELLAVAGPGYSAYIMHPVSPEIDSCIAIFVSRFYSTGATRIGDAR